MQPTRIVPGIVRCREGHQAERIVSKEMGSRLVFMSAIFLGASKLLHILAHIYIPVASVHSPILVPDWMVMLGIAFIPS